jgi:hypothetical protein
MLRVLDHFWTPVVACLGTLDAVRIGNSFITISTTRNYNRLFHPYTFTQFTNTTL